MTTNTTNRITITVLITLLTLFLTSSRAGEHRRISHYKQVNLVSDEPGVALLQDSNLVNAWGISFTPNGPFWISDNGTGKSTLYVVTNDAIGSATVSKQPLEVAIPGEGNPTGQLFNNNSGAFNGDFFIFVSEDGTISGWRPALGTNAETLATRTGAVYKGVALVTNAAGPVLLVANFSEGTVDAYNGSGGLITQFRDSSAPAGYAPFNVQSVEGMIFVTFAKQDEEKEDDVAGPGNGLIDVFDLQRGTFHRFATGSDAGGSLDEINSPWGIALAPGTFGQHAGELLVGNFGSGTIMAFDARGNFKGELLGVHRKPISIEGLWAIAFGNGGRAGAADTLFFTAGPEDESHGLFGSIELLQPHGHHHR